MANIEELKVLWSEFLSDYNESLKLKKLNSPLAAIRRDKAQKLKDQLIKGLNSLI